jgi:outer membrane protein OmpA-like peptidoglycan-associated protein
MKKYRMLVSIIIVFIALFANNCFAQRRVNNRGPKINKPKPAAVAKDNEAVTKLVCPANFPTMHFAANKSTLSNNAKLILGAIVKQLKDNPEIKLNVTVNGSFTKSAQTLCFRRGQVIIIYLTEKEGISYDRITINCDIENGLESTVDFQCE